MKLNRRKLLQVAGIAGVTTVAVSQLSSPAKAKQNSKTKLLAQADQYSAQVDAGLSYFQEQAVAELPLVEALAAAIASGDLAAAQQAYIESRPPYEQIEVLALNFEDTDTNIDARPYAFDNGEADEGFKGFHRIEALIFRDEDLASAQPYADELVTSVKTLMTNLEARENFDSPSHFEGMIGLATEIPAKKISSEEETYSDQSLLIFQENWKGIYSQFEPFATVLESVDSDAVTQVKEAYKNAIATISPYFTDGQIAAQPYSSLTAPQKSAIVKAAYSFRDSLIDAQIKLGIV
ncbi:EfeM/EfeO family lipoprotein [Waterburya agarophytonicola K14]|uniref:EfeM/EfeO family lipoprotein n=1 Tax=Waterburya agarophytonicola KI4 TaxID=2874699 RepID=A0A964BP34_9CYAN|nr:EfeM/EfeO family lipoprotein [Waterburya agarophytonicola]MCC0176257.1 EfeM/EfeO family lipoprotein [Waterburya agarophytonicola KI4]